MFYIVQVVSDTVDGKKSCVILVTEDLKKAISTAGEIERLGFTCHSPTTGAHVTRLEAERVYKGTEFQRIPAFDTPDREPAMAVYSRYRWGDHFDEWVEEWFDKEAEKRFKDAS